MASASVHESEFFSREVEDRTLLELKDVDFGGSPNLEEEEGDSQEVMLLNFDNYTFEGIRGPPHFQSRVGQSGQSMHNPLETI